jgi:hypothetical protein
MDVSKGVKKIPSAVLVNARSKLNEAMDLLMPYLITLSPDERQTLVNMGADSVEFLEKAHDLTVKYSKLIPRLMKSSVFAEESATIRELDLLINKLKLLEDSLSDIQLIMGGDVLEIALDFYHTIKIAAMRDIPGAGVVYEELKPWFPFKKNAHKKAV